MWEHQTDRDRSKGVVKCGTTVNIIYTGEPCLSSGPQGIAGHSSVRGVAWRTEKNTGGSGPTHETRFEGRRNAQDSSVLGCLPSGRWHRWAGE